MGRILIVIGVLLLIVGIVLPFAASFDFMRDIGSFTDAVASDPSAADLCRTGETLEVEYGASTRTGTSGTSSGRSAVYFCVTAAGERRDVTTSFVGNLVDDVATISGPFGSILTSSIGATVLTVGGILLIIAGVFVSARGGSRSARRIVGVEIPFNPTNPGGGGRSMIDALKEQLDAAYRNGKLTREEYERAVEQLKHK